MKYEVIENLVKQSSGEIIVSYKHVFETSEEALDHVLFLHQSCKGFTATFLDIYVNRIGE